MARNDGHDFRPPDVDAGESAHLLIVDYFRGKGDRPNYFGGYQDISGDPL